MPRKKGAGVKHPEKAHPTLTAEESHSRLLERQRYRRARRKLEASVPLHSGGLSDPGDQAVLVTRSEFSSKDIHRYESKKERVC